MSYYALKDVDWPWDDEDEGRAIVVRADTPEEAVKIATAIHLADFPGAGGVTWDVARLNLVAFGDASWEEDNQPRFESLTYYADGINGPPDLPPALSVPPEIEGGDKGDGWQPMDAAPKDKTPIIIAVPTKDQDDFIIGEAYFDPESYEGGDWWWAGTSHGDYTSSPISDCNHHPPAFWQHLPAAPSASIEGETP